MNNKSTLRITTQTKQRIRKLATNTNETYDSILSRLIDCKIGDTLLEYNILFQNQNIKVQIDWNKEYKNIKLIKPKHPNHEIIKFIKTFNYYNIIAPLDLNERVYYNSICFERIK